MAGQGPLPYPPPPGQPRTTRPWVTVGIVLVSIWMALSLGYTWLILGLGSLYVCQAPGEGQACLDRYNAWWFGLLFLHFVVIAVTIVLWMIPRTRAWGAVVGFVGTGIPAIAFTVVSRVPL